MAESKPVTEPVQITQLAVTTRDGENATAPARIPGDADPNDEVVVHLDIVDPAKIDASQEVIISLYYMDDRVQWIRAMGGKWVGGNDPGSIAMKISSGEVDLRNREVKGELASSLVADACGLRVCIEPPYMPPGATRELRGIAEWPLQR